MDLGYLQSAAQAAHERRKQVVDFEYGFYIAFRLQNGTVKQLHSGSRGHVDFRPSFKHKMNLINRILWS